MYCERTHNFQGAGRKNKKTIEKTLAKKSKNTKIHKNHDEKNSVLYY